MKRPIFAVLLGVGSATALVTSTPQQPTFRTTTDLIAVDVQVVNNQGLPVVGLGAEKFEVELNGNQRRVASVELIQYDSARVVHATSPAPTAPSDGRAASDRPRVFILAIDTWSFDVATTRGMMAAARQFVERLQPSDQIGLFAFPLGPEMDPTTDHASIVTGLQKVLGGRQPPPMNKFRLAASEVIDGGRLAAQRICRSSPSNIDPNCLLEVESEVRMQAQYFEAMAVQSLGRLRDLIRGLARLDRRKTLVLLSGGMPLSDRPGQRPDVGDLGVLVGQEAARANTAVYTLFVDWKFLEQFSAASTRASSSPLRESSLNMQWLDHFSGTAGGKLFTVSTGTGTFAFDRILTETSAYYLLGVAPEDVDRDGRPRRLNVKVKQGGITVRARAWVVVPRRP